MIVSEKLFNQKLFRKLKVEIVMNGDEFGERGVWAITIKFPSRGPYSKLTRKQVEPLRKQIERSLHSSRMKTCQCGKTDQYEVIYHPNCRPKKK